MRTKQVLVLIGAAAVSSAVLAAPAASVSSDGNTVTVHGLSSQLVHLTPDQVQDATGSFRLQDGRKLMLTSRHNKVFMEVDGKREELLPLSGSEFVAADSGSRVVLDDRAFAGQVHLTELRRTH